MEILKVPAIEVKQSPGRKLYSFAVDGKLVSRFATISRVKREDGQLRGYQRPEVVSHIEEIRNYLESSSPMIPNAIVIAFDSRVKFKADRPGASNSYSRTGTLHIPVDDSLSEAEKPGFVVDGQQRLAAVREAEIPAFPLCVSAFVTDDVHTQTEQFILVNSTKPLPKGLIYELLPTTQAQLPSLLHRRRFPALLVDKLNRRAKSPLFQKIQTPTNPDGTIKDNSILRMLENSLSDGALYRFRYSADEPDITSMEELLWNFWRAVSESFPEAWGLSPKKSRLVHGAGIVSMGFVMDAICSRYRQLRVPSREQFQKDLAPLKEACSWTSGYWEFAPDDKRRWDQVQNTSRDIDTLTHHLIFQYKTRVWHKARGRGQRTMFEA